LADPIIKVAGLAGNSLEGLILAIAVVPIALITTKERTRQLKALSMKEGNSHMGT